MVVFVAKEVRLPLDWGCDDDDDAVLGRIAQNQMRR